MSEITKLYENAGIGYLMYVVDTFPPVEYPQIDFNEKKQLELIKWLMKYDEIHGDYNDGYGFSTLNYSGKYKKDFEESLASVINNELWQDLTEEEKQQVKGILE